MPFHKVSPAPAPTPAKLTYRLGGKSRHFPTKDTNPIRTA